MHPKIYPALLAISATVALSACSSTAPRPADDLEVAFMCTNGTAIAVRFSPANETAVLTHQGSSITLAQQPSGSGFIYSNGPHTIRGKGDALTVEIGRMVPLQCTAQ